MVSLADLTAEHFADQIGCGFRVELPEHRETLTLESIVTKHKSPDPGRFRDPFTLYFKGESTTAVLDQHLFPLKNEKLGEMEIFLVPIGRNEDGTFRYQAVFS